MFGVSKRGGEGADGLVATLARAVSRLSGLFRREVSVAVLNPDELVLLELHGWEPYERAEPIREVPDVVAEPRPRRRNSKAGRELVSQVQVEVLADDERRVG